MKLKNILATSLATFAIAGFSQAALITINLEAISDGVASSAGVPLPDGTALGVGFFTSDGTAGGTVLTDVQISSLGSSAALDAAFVEFGAGQYTAGFGPGFDGAISDSFQADNAGFFGRTIYTYINAGGEVGVFKNIVAGPSDLTFPSGADIFTDTATFGFDRANRMPDSAILIGSYDGALTNPTLGVGGTFKLAPIPEPSAAALLAGSIGVILFRRRRR